MTRRSSRIAEWADLVGEEVPEAALEAAERGDGVGSEERSDRGLDVGGSERSFRRRR